MDILNYQIMYNPSVISEELLREGLAMGLCISPDMSDLNSERVDLMAYYRTLALIPEQTHSCNVALADSNLLRFENTDALLTFKKGLPIGIKTADCVPILIYAPEIQCVGAIHAGWKGTLGGIVDNVMDVLGEYGGDPAGLKVAFGPSISKDVYEVSQELAESFVEAGFGKYVSPPLGSEEKSRIDLQGVNMERFLKKGVSIENIFLHKGCTFSSRKDDGTPMYASHRRSKGALARMLTYILLRSDDRTD